MTRSSERRLVLVFAQIGLGVSSAVLGFPLGPTKGEDATDACNLRLGIVFKMNTEIIAKRISQSRAQNNARDFGLQPHVSNASDLWTNNVLNARPLTYWYTSGGPQVTQFAPHLGSKVRQRSLKTTR